LETHFSDGNDGIIITLKIDSKSKLHTSEINSFTFRNFLNCTFSKIAVIKEMIHTKYKYTAEEFIFQGKVHLPTDNLTSVDNLSNKVIFLFHESSFRHKKSRRSEINLNLPDILPKCPFWISFIHTMEDATKH
jgi:hypothetical protein